MRQTAILVDAVIPCLEPIDIQRRDIEHGLQRECGSVAVASVTKTLDVGAINHISIKGQVLKRIADHVVDSVHVLVRGLECRGRLIIRTRPVPFDILRFGSLGKVLKNNVAEHVMVELVLEMIPIGSP